MSDDTQHTEPAQPEPLYVNVGAADYMEQVKCFNLTVMALMQSDPLRPISPDVLTALNQCKGYATAFIDQQQKKQEAQNEQIEQALTDSASDPV